ncbi:TOTE conflict system archaeo-eukaryotic primase domain-containing protein [Micromonospora sp.]|uniref:TOTE conflict system archaeo-eukaryotic primase domain-containing protein n=1 Tax=Micromonospora sp. TaxID=1876 RepID=UPI003B3A5D79
MTAAGGYAAAWDLTRVLSPRPRVRLADVDERDGRPLNRYGTELPTSASAPDRPWAMYLTDRQGRYRLLAFDLDTSRGSVEADAAALTEILARAGIRAVRCISGPGGGRHLWVGLADPVAATVVRRIAEALSALLPTLDHGLLVNPRTGCVRPPGAPHRSGTESMVIAGDIADLTDPARRVPAAWVLRLADLVEEMAGVTAAETAARTGRVVTAAVATDHTPTDLQRRVALDDDGQPFLPGARRPMAAVSAAALREPVPAGADASRVLARILAGAAAAHWRLADLVPLVATAPGMEHVRTGRAGGRRQPRPPGQQVQVLRAQWNRQVEHVASQPRRAGAAAGDPTFEARELAAITAVMTVQRRADSAPGRWARPGGPTDRRVLDALCDQILAAVATDIEADCRRLAILTGIAKSTATVALGRLVADGWITRTGESEGRAAARWAIPTVVERPQAELSTGDPCLPRSQAVTRRPAPPSRASVRAALGRRLTDQAHDVWTPAGLGHHHARTHTALTSTAQTISDVMAITGYSRSRTMRHLDDLAGHRLASVDRAGRWRRPGRDHRRRAARDFGIDGTLAARAARYAIEREAWWWWLDELAWRRAGKRQQRLSPGAGQMQLVAAGGQLIREHHGPHPTSGGRADFTAARTYLTSAASSRRRAS